MGLSLVARQDGIDADAIAEREAEITGKPPRIAPMAPAEVGQDIWDVLNAVRATIGLGPTDSLGSYALTMANHPKLMTRQVEMGATIFSGLLPARERELCVLRIGWLLGAPYEWGEHVDIAKRYGVTSEEIERVVEGSAAPGWSKHEAAILRGVEEMLVNQMVSDATWAVLCERWDARQLIEFPMMVGQYVCTAIVQNTLRLRLESGNTGLTYR